MKYIAISSFFTFIFFVWPIGFSGAFTLSEPEMTTTWKVAVKKMEVIATAYYKPLANQHRYATGSFRGDVKLNGSGKITSSGKKPRAGITVSADPRVLPMGTVIFVPGFGVGVVEDTGGAIKGKRLDLFMGEGDKALSEAMKWGKRKAQILILDHASTKHASIKSDAKTF